MKKNWKKTKKKKKYKIHGKNKYSKNQKNGSKFWEILIFESTLFFDVGFYSKLEKSNKLDIVPKRKQKRVLIDAAMSCERKFTIVIELIGNFINW